ncbi:MAG: efflux transporter periplasmic adaptor subunit [Cytophagales bacterium CG18_big_fil_WC_8_21_14_2_50_42_9]|nr:MAG: efflux transporter periplasmic adaptor subunit [Cytophagales bacterium CG18_big_fil_WC_8_21_14_2_50_42_9]
MKIAHLFALPLLIAGLSACNHAKETSTPKENQAVISEIKVTEVMSMQPTKPIVIPGELLPLNKVGIHAKVKGFVKTVRVDRGAQVKKGQVLAVLDAPEVIAELDQARGMLHAAEAALHEAKAKTFASKQSYIRLQKANKTNGAIAPVELEQAQARMLGDSAALANAMGNVRAARSHLNSKKQLVSYLTITAPFNGTIIERNISPGTLVGADAANALFYLEDQSVLRLTVAIPEKYANFLNNKKPVTFAVTAIPDKEFTAPFARSSQSINESARVMMTEFEVKNPGGELKAGMYAQVQLPLLRQSETLFVPQTSVVDSDEKVFVISTASGKAKWINVQKGMAVDTLIEVFGDVQKGDLIALEASEEIRDGQVVKTRR